MTQNFFHVILEKFRCYVKWIHVLIPPISALRALVSLSQTGSITKTADAVGLTQSAISHQMRTLEDRLSFEVIRKRGRNVELTPRARQYVAEIAPALKALAEASGTVQITGALRLNVAPGFAASWLAPRIGDFIAAHPGLRITINTPKGYGDLGTREDDLYVSFLPETLVPSHAIKLMSVAFFPVAAPRLTGGKQFRHAEEAMDYPLLHLDDVKDWSSWFGSAGKHVELRKDDIVFQDMQIMAAMTRAGLGVSLGDALTSEAALARGELIRLHSHEWASSRSYWLIEGNGGDTDARRVFKDWMISMINA